MKKQVKKAAALLMAAVMALSLNVVMPGKVRAADEPTAAPIGTVATYDFKTDKKFFGNDNAALAAATSVLSEDGFVKAEITDKSKWSNNDEHGLKNNAKITFTVKVPANAVAEFTYKDCMFSNSNDVKMYVNDSAEAAKTESTATAETKSKIDGSAVFTYKNTASAEATLKFVTSDTANDKYIHSIAYKVTADTPSDEQEQQPTVAPIGTVATYDFKTDKKFFGNDNAALAAATSILSEDGFVKAEITDASKWSNNNGHGLQNNAQITFTVKVPANAVAEFTYNDCCYSNPNDVKMYVNGSTNAEETKATATAETKYVDQTNPGRDGSAVFTYKNTASADATLKFVTSDTASDKYIHSIAYKVTAIPQEPDPDTTGSTPVNVQYKKIADDNYTVRTVYEISEADIAKYDKVGVRLTANSQSDDVLGATVFKSLKANGQTVSAAGDKYYVIIQIENVTANAEITVKGVAQTGEKVEELSNVSGAVKMAEILGTSSN